MNLRWWTSLAAVTAILLPAAAGADAPIAWKADLVHSRAEFTVSHLIVSKVTGYIPMRSLTIETANGSVIPQKIDAVLDVAHEDTGNPDRDSDLRSNTYFDVAKYPTMAFHSTKIVSKGADDFDVTGDLTIKNVTKPITFPAHLEGRIPDREGTRVGYTGTLHVDRRDWGVVDNRLTAAGVLLVGYNVDIALTVDASTADASVKTPAK